MAIPEFTMRQLLECGVHFGHHTRRWNPKMAPYIFGVRNGVHIIDLEQTVPMLHRALQAIRDVAAGGGRVLFVGTKRQAQEPVAEAARRCGQYYVNHRWLGGMLTNFKTISQSIKRLRELDERISQPTPGLTKREKRYAMSFVAAGVPLFLAGIGLAWMVLPNAVKFLTNFTPKGASNYINADDYLTFVTRIMLAFGVAFVVPLLLVALNMAGVMSAATLGRGWRIAVFLTFLFAAIASPTPDAGSMLALAFPMTGLYVLAWAIAWLNDRRKARRAAADPLAGLSDDEASALPDELGAYGNAYDDDVDDQGVDQGTDGGVDVQAGDRPSPP